MSITDIFSKIDKTQKIKISSDGNIVKLFIPLVGEYKSVEVLITCTDEKIVKETKEKLAKGINMVLSFDWNSILPIIEPLLKGLKI
jgi:hypothetical protein